MGLKELKKEVEEQYTLKKDNFLKTILIEKDNFLKNKNEDYEKFLEIQKNEYSLELEKEKKKISMVSDKKLKEIIFNKKKEKYDIFYEELYNKLKQLNDDQIVGFFDKTITRIKKDFSIEKVYVCEKLYKLIRIHLSRTIELGVDDSVTGFKFTNKEETQILNYSFENIVKDLIDKNILKIERGIY